MSKDLVTMIVSIVAAVAASTTVTLMVIAITEVIHTINGTVSSPSEINVFFWVWIILTGIVYFTLVWHISKIK